LLRSWLFRFDRTSDEPRFVATDLGTPLRTRAHALLEPLRRMGVKGQVLDDPALATLLAQLYGSGPPGEGDAGAGRQAYADRADNVEINGRYYASFVVNRYPGEEVEPAGCCPSSASKGSCMPASTSSRSRQIGC
jgi:hypothetical protein